MRHSVGYNLNWHRTNTPKQGKSEVTEHTVKDVFVGIGSSPRQSIREHCSLFQKRTLIHL